METVIDIRSAITDSNMGGLSTPVIRRDTVVQTSDTNVSEKEKQGGPEANASNDESKQLGTSWE